MLLQLLFATGKPRGPRDEGYVCLNEAAGQHEQQIDTLFDVWRQDVMYSRLGRASPCLTCNVPYGPQLSFSPDSREKDVSILHRLKLYEIDSTPNTTKKPVMSEVGRLLRSVRLTPCMQYSLA